MSKTSQSKALNLAVVFSIVFAFLILISIVLKTISLFQKSIFDGKNHFTLSVINGSKKALLISLSPRNNTLYMLNVKDGQNKDLSTLLEIPIEGRIYANSKISDKNIKTEFFKFLIPFSIDKTNLNAVDVLRLWFYINFVPINSIYQQEISANDNKSVLKNLGIYSYFVDQGIAEEKISIEIINGTNVFGLGNKLAGFLSNMGANVVMVSTSEKEVSKSRIDYLNKESYTLKKLIKVLHFKPYLTTKKGLGNITIIIGKDILDKVNF